METFYTLCAVIGGTVLVCQFLLTLLGLGGGHDGGGDHGFDAGHDGGTGHDGTHEDRKSTRLNSSHIQKSRMPSSA